MRYVSASRRVTLVICGALALWAAFAAYEPAPSIEAQSVPRLAYGSQGEQVRLLQWRLQQWGYYSGPIDGVFGSSTQRAVRLFQQRNGLRVDGIVGQETWAALGLLRQVTGGATQAAQPAQAGPSAAGNRNETLELLARVIAAEAEGEPYVGQVAVGAVILNRVRHPDFPNTIAGVIYQPHAFESVTNGLIWRRTPSAEARRAAQDALNGWDPTYGALFFWNPYKPVSAWIWSRPIIVQHGNHVFAR